MRFSFWCISLSSAPRQLRFYDEILGFVEHEISRRQFLSCFAWCPLHSFQFNSWAVGAHFTCGTTPRRRRLRSPICRENGLLTASLKQTAKWNLTSTLTVSLKYTAKCNLNSTPTVSLKQTAKWNLHSTHGIFETDCEMEFRNLSVAAVSVFMAALILSCTSGCFSACSGSTS